MVILQICGFVRGIKDRAYPIGLLFYVIRAMGSCPHRGFELTSSRPNSYLAQFLD
jgi:hypothetical protein